MDKRAVSKVIISLVVIAFIFKVMPFGIVRADGTTVTFSPPSDDAYVYQTNPDTNYGSNTALRVAGSPVMKSYLRFNVSGLNGAAITSAKLQVYAESTSTTGYTVYSVSNTTWTEGTITYNNAPTLGASLGSSGPIPVLGWTTVDITAYIKSEGPVNLALATSGSQTKLDSKESGGNAPILSLQINGQPDQNPSVTPTSTWTKTPVKDPTITRTSSYTRTPTNTKSPTKTKIPSKTATPTFTASPTGTAIAATVMPTTANDPVLVGAGDIANCASNYSSLTAQLLQNIPGTIFTAGDNANPDGSTVQFNNCFNSTWGQFKSRIQPSAGNHDYMTTGAAPYYAYFGSAAGDPQKGYYSYDLGTWHIIVLNSQCTPVGSCKVGYPEEQWLLADLKAHTTNRCTLAVWHIPRFSSGHAGNHTEYQPFWQDLYNYGVEIVINGHDHDYERFALQDPAGTPDPQHGIREFVVGTGGDDHTPFNATPAANSQVRISYTFGVLKLNLHPGSYDWQFIPVAGQTLSDAGSGVCH